MYGWIWRMLPGNLVTRAFTALVLAGLVAAVLWYVVFPWIEPRISLDPAVVGR
ncbi:hypothetical protein GCM10022252_09230 [Streptosporangium oxazolinicum]|uniref:ABC transporter permease n=1 Tax=Streptosporangium oxazolinicum TaxID=909287 RepID=A0ABP8AF82_9ACTN